MYGYNGIGLVPVRRNVPLTTGICTHRGVEYLLNLLRKNKKPLVPDVDDAVTISTGAYKELVKTTKDLSIEGDAQAEFTYHEQMALTEAMVRVWAAREMKRIRRGYVVLEVERELEYPLTRKFPSLLGGGKVEIVHESRLDALLRVKEGEGLGDVVAYSLKTQKRFDTRAAKSYEKDLQGPLELWSAEQHLHEINLATDSMIEDGLVMLFPDDQEYARDVRRLLESRHLPNIVRQVSFCYLIKGDWKKDKTGIKRTYCPLIRGYRNAGPASIEYAHSYDWVEGGGDRWDPQAIKHRLGKGWIPFNSWETEGGVRGWMELLATGTVQVDAGDPLTESVITPPEYFRHKDDVRSRVRQYALSEQRICEKVSERVYAAEAFKATGIPQWEPDGFFEQNTQSCHFPTDCELLTWCWGDQGAPVEEVRADPIGSGVFEYRKPHHAGEREALKGLDSDNIPF